MDFFAHITIGKQRCTCLKKFIDTKIKKIYKTYKEFNNNPNTVCVKAPLIDAITACNPRTSLSECIIRRLASGVSPLATSVFQVWKSALTNSQKTDYLMDLCEIDQENVCIVLPLHLLKWTTYTNKAQCVFGLTPIEAIVELIMSSSLIESIEGKLSGL